VIEVRQVRLSYGRVPALNDVSLQVSPGEHVALMGPAAAGKSTLAKVMDGLLLPDSGDCLVDGVSTKEDPMRARRLVGLVFQEPEDQAVARRVEDDVAFGPVNLGVSDVGERVNEAMRQAGIEQLAGRSIHSLSGGQKQLVAIAGVLAMRPAYLVMDEPTSMLDGKGTKMVAETIASLKRAGKGIVVITHDPAMAAMADRIVVMDAGNIIANGSPREVFSSCPEGLIELPETVRLSRALGHRRLWLNVEEAKEDLCR
jgi:energy-coupling factor transport system ATP-binding protein